MPLLPFHTAIKNLLNKRAILIPHQSLDLTGLSSGSGKRVLNYLRQEIDEHAFGGF
jgi:hypothetical protein